MLHLRGFFPAWEKVRQVEFHPVQPWLAAVTKADHVCVWDWSNQQIIQEFQLGGTEEEMLQDIDIARYNLKDTEFQVNPTLQQTSPLPLSRSSTGHIKDVKFLDLEVAQVQLSTQHYLINGTGTTPPSAEQATSLRGKRLLVVVCDSKALVYDLLTKQASEVPRTNLDGKGPTCVSFLFQGGPHSSAVGPVMRRPGLAFGCSDGVVRVLQYGSFQVMCRLVSGHKSAIQCICTFQARGVPWEQVVVGHSYGSMVSWEPFATSSQQVRELSPKLDVKAHDKEVVGMGLVCVQEDPENTKKVLYTAGVDNRLVGWDVTSFKEVSKTKLDSKAQTTCMATSSRGFVANGVHSIYVGTEIGVLLSLHALTGSTRLVCNLNGLIPVGQKKQPKIYWVAVHPLQPQFVALGANTGTVLLSSAAPPSLPAAPLPLRSPLQAHQFSPSAPSAASAAALPMALPSPGGRASGSGSGVTFLCQLGDALLCLTFSTVEAEQQSSKQAAAAAAATAAIVKAAAARTPADQLDLLLEDDSSLQQPPGIPGAGPPSAVPVSGPGSGRLRWAVPQLVSRLKVVADRPAQKAVVTVSFDGAYAAVVWPAMRQYSLYFQGAAAWDEIATGKGSSVAWHATLHQFAVLEEAVATPPVAPAAADKKKKGKDKVDAVEVAAAQAAIRRSTEVPALVQIKQVAGRAVSLVHRNLLMAPDDRPVAVTSGPLLAVTYRKAAKDSELVSGDDGAAAMQLFGWDDACKAGPELPEPTILAWDQSISFAALAYSAQVVLCVVKPSFRVIASIPMVEVTCMQWASRQLYVVTPTHIHVVFVSLPSGAPNPNPVHVVTLASFSDGLSPPPAWLQPPPSASLLPTPVARPPGSLALLGPRDGTLWLMNSQGLPLALSLDHPGLLCMSLLAAGDRSAALGVATQQLPASAHDALAAFALDMDGGGAAAGLLGLSGLSLAVEARLRIQVNHWPGALEAVGLLLQGLSFRPAPGSSLAAVSAASTAEVARALQPAAVAPMASKVGGPVYDALGGLAAPTTAAFDLEPDGDGTANATMGTGAIDEGLFVGGSGSAGTYGSGTAAGSAHAGPPFANELDWTQPLRQGLGAGPVAVTVAAGGVGEGSGKSTAAVEAGLDLGLEAAEKLAAAGLKEAGRQAAGLLLRLPARRGKGGAQPGAPAGLAALRAAAGQLGERRLTRLALCMADLGMHGELAALAVAGAGTGSGGAALLCAALSGQPRAMDALLGGPAGAAGVASGLASVHASSRALPSAGAALAQWKEALAGAEPGIGAPRLTVASG